MAPHDSDMLDAAKAYGIDDGFTIPGNVYGAARGSVTFATEVGAPFPEDTLFAAQAFGNFVFQKMLDLGWNRHLPSTNILTERQLECVMWVGRGKCTWAIATLMGISVNTVKKHLAEACERYEVETRAVLPIKALYLGSLHMTDLFS
jgi:DNA-binding CsgD family transcriptional regulator